MTQNQISIAHNHCFNLAVVFLNVPNLWLYLKINKLAPMIQLNQNQFA